MLSVSDFIAYVFHVSRRFPENRDEIFILYNFINKPRDLGQMDIAGRPQGNAFYVKCQLYSKCLLRRPVFSSGLTIYSSHWNHLLKFTIFNEVETFEGHADVTFLK